MQGDSRLVRSSQGETDTWTLSKEEPGIEPATFRLSVDPLFLLGYMTPDDKQHDCCL